MDWKRRFKVLLGIVVILFLILGGCANDEENKSTELEGTWKSPICSYSSDAGMDKQVLYVFSDNTLHMYDHYYETTDESCVGPALDQDASFTFTLGDPVDTASDIKEFDFVKKGISYTPRSDSGLTVANDDCDGDVTFTVIDETKPVTDTKCDHFTSMTVDVEYYSAYELDEDLEPDEVYFSQADAEPDESLRPTTVDKVNARYIKQ